MAKENEDFKKIFFVQEIDEDDFETEGLWCQKKGNYYVVDNIPFIAERISVGDTIKAKYDEEDEVLYFDGFIAVSGNTTVRIFYKSQDQVDEIREKLRELGCESEVLQQRRIIAVDIPKKIDYRPIQKYLADGEKENRWDYEESCLAHEY